MELPILKTGSIAVYETVGRGFIPARVLCVKRNPAYSHIVTVQLKLRDSPTTRRAGYRGGEVVETSTIHAIPRAALRRCRWHTWISAFDVFVDGEAEPLRFAGAGKYNGG